MKTTTFQELINDWLLSKKDTIKESTYIHYKKILENHIIPELGNHTINTMNTTDIDHLLRKKLRNGNLSHTAGLAPKTVVDIRSLLILIIKYAHEQNYTCSLNTNLFYPRTNKNMTKVMNRKEQMALETFLNNDIQNPFHLGILLTLYSGLRIGEICALQWQDFDFRNGTIMISKTLYRIQTENPDNNQKTKIIIESPKTESSIRVIPLPSFILNICINNCGKNQCYVLTGTEKYMEPRLCLKKSKIY